MELKKAKHDVTYCVNDECDNKKNCERHKNRWNFNKEENYCFAEFDENNCVWKECEKHGIKI